MHDCDIAIIGYTCRVPDAANSQEFWDNLAKGKEAVRSYSEEELRAEGITEELLRDPHFVRAGTEFKDVGLLDASFFGFTPTEAETMNPQVRIFLEQACELIDQAGYDPQRYKKPIGVYAGMGTNAYLPPTNSMNSVLDLSFVIGTEKDFLATLTSYKLNLTGPSLTVQTGCSTSLVAVHLACQGLLAGDCAMALAGGISIAIPEMKGYLYEPGGITSPDGHCRAFDAAAEGAIGGSGIGLVLLKRLSDAIAEGDLVHAIIKGSAVNNDGSMKVGYTAPSVEGQARVIRAAQMVAGVEAESIRYIEAHGTGTPVGDPIEVTALSQAFRATTQKKAFCAIGSVKTNIGHLDTAAGVIGLIKTILALKHRQIPASLHFRSPNPGIDFENSPFFVNNRLREWEGPRPLRAGISSFSIGGTNAHVIVEEAPQREPSAPGRSQQLIILSARTKTALEKSTQNLVSHLDACRKDNLADIAYTLQSGRREFAYRRAVVCRTREDAIERLQGLAPDEVQEGVVDDDGGKVVFMFPGQGSQFVGMGKGIYGEERAFRQVIDECSEKLKTEIGIDLRELLYPVGDQKESAQSRLRETALTQPAIFVLEYALAKLWIKWGLKPAAMLGHSIGEYVAACIAGVMAEDDALRLVAARGRLMQQQPSGAMLAVEMSEQETLRELKPGLWLAAVNGSRQCVLSGVDAVVRQVQTALESRDIVCHRLNTSHAFHSGMMEPLLCDFSDAIKRVQLRRPQVRFVSNVSGSWITDEEATDSEYWVRHLREPVRFGTGVTTIFKDVSKPVFLEVGPGNSLAGMVREEGKRHKRAVVVSCLPRSESCEPEMAFLLNSAGKLWTEGARLQWREFHEGERRLRVPLPTYPFERNRYWISDHNHQGKIIATKSIAQTTKQADIADWFYAPVWKQTPFLQPAGERAQRVNWLIFLDDAGKGKYFGEQLATAGHTVVLVKKGDLFEVREHAITIDPRERKHYGALIAELAKRNSIPHRVLHLWSISEEGGRVEDLSLEEDDIGFISLLFLAQTLDEFHITSPIQLLVMTAEAHLVTGDEKLSPAAASVIGPCLVIPQEYPNLQCRCIDIDRWGFAHLAGMRRTQVLIKELQRNCGDLLTAYRRGQRWVRTFEKVALPETGNSTRLREQGVYLISGGLGRIGLAIAEYLARNAKARLVLISRAKFPAQEEWEEYLGRREKDRDNDTFRKVERLFNLRKLGAEILVASVDVSNLEAVRRVVSETHRRFGPINGLIHAAGNTDVRLLKNMSRLTPVDFHEQVCPKVIGLRTLQSALADESLDFALLLSSLSSVLGGIGYSAYSAANVFMDAISDWCRQQGVFPCISINSDGWDFRDAAERRASAGSTEALAMLPDEGVQALHRILQAEELIGQVVVSTGDLNERIHSWVAQPVDAIENQESLAASSPVHRDSIGSDYVAPQNPLQAAIAEVWEEMLGISRLGIYDNFLELGGHSLLGLRISSRIRKLFEVNFTVANLYEAPTIAGVANFITNTLITDSTPAQIQHLLKTL